MLISPFVLSFKNHKPFHEGFTIFFHLLQQFVDGLCVFEKQFPGSNLKQIPILLEDLHNFSSLSLHLCDVNYNINVF